MAGSGLRNQQEANKAKIWKELLNLWFITQKGKIVSPNDQTYWWKISPSLNLKCTVELITFASLTIHGIIDTRWSNYI